MGDHVREEYVLCVGNERLQQNNGEDKTNLSTEAIYHSAPRHGGSTENWVFFMNYEGLNLALEIKS